MDVPRVALVSGAAGGIGLATANRMASEGWHIVMFDQSTSLAAAADEVREHASGPDAVIPLLGDVRSEEDVSRAVHRAREEGDLLLTFANAGIGGANRPLFEVELDDFTRVMDVNLKGVFLTCKYAAKAMCDQGAGSIVVTSSVMWQSPVRGESVYNASKAAVVGLAQGLALDVAPYGVRVNVIAPGSIRTEMHYADIRRRAEADGRSNEDVERDDANAVPLGRIADASEVAGVVAFLASDDASYITGSVLSVNGGLVLHF